MEKAEYEILIDEVLGNSPEGDESLWSQLPNDLTFELFARLDAKTRVNAAQVCKVLPTFICLN
jgi:hypothetical protein